jgi:DNA polymerase-3 subunit beta
MKAVSGRSTTPILDCLLVTALDGGIRLLGNDMEIGIETAVLTAEVEKTGEIALTAKVFADIVRRLPGETVHIECMEILSP